MRVVIQRVRYARLSVGGELISQISQGLMVLVGIAEEDGREEINYLCKKLAALRIFDDDEGVMTRSVVDVGGEVMLVSQFTLMANTKKGNRPSYIHAARPEISRPLYEEFCSALEEVLGKEVARGRFGADMQIELVNDGPVTITIDTVRDR